MTKLLAPPIAALVMVVGVITHAQQQPEGTAAARQRRPERQRGATTAEGNGRTEQQRADQVLQRMSTALTSLRTFRVTTDFALEVVTREGQKLEYVGTSNVAVRRPNGMRVDRQGEQSDLSFFYNGRTVTLYGRRANLYATAAAPPQLDQAIDFARERLDIEAPAADLLYSDPQRVLTEDARTGRYVGQAVIDGVRCDHIAYRGRQVDWQLWIEAGERALPRRYTILTKDVRGQPEFTVELRDWELEPALPETLFTFTPPPSATQIEFLAQREGLRSPVASTRARRAGRR